MLVRIVATSGEIGSRVAPGDLYLDLVGGRLGASTGDSDFGIVFHHLGVRLSIGDMIATACVDQKDRDDSKERPRHPDGMSGERRHNYLSNNKISLQRTTI
jgi:hypothetical protein